MAPSWGKWPTAGVQSPHDRLRLRLCCLRLCNGGVSGRPCTHKSLLLSNDHDARHHRRLLACMQGSSQQSMVMML